MDTNNQSQDPQDQEILNENTDVIIVKTEQDKPAIKIIGDDLMKNLEDAAKEASLLKIEWKKNKKKLLAVDITNKAGMEQLKEMRAKLRTSRVKLTKKSAEDVKPLVDAVAFHRNGYKAIISELEIMEEPFDKKHEELKKAKAEADQREALEAQARLDNRINTIEDYGMAMIDGYYTAGNVKYEVPLITIGIADLNVMPDVSFDMLLTKISEANSLVAERKDAEEKRLQKEKEEQEAEAEKQRLQLLSDQEAVKKEQEKLLQQKKDQEAELLEMRKARLEIRGTQLENIGMVFNKKEDNYYFPESLLNCAVEYMASANKAEWNDTLVDYTTRITAIKKELADLKEAEEKKQALILARWKQLESIGFKFHNASKDYRYEDIVMDNEIIEIAPEVAWNENIEGLQNIIEQMKIKAEEKRLANIEKEKQDRILENKRIADTAIEDKRIADELAEKNRLEAIAASSDTEKYAAVISQLKSLSMPEMKSAAYKEKLGIIKDFINDL